MRHCKRPDAETPQNSPAPAPRAWRVGPGGCVGEHGGLVRDAGQAGAGQEAAQLAQRQAAQRRRQRGKCQGAACTKVGGRKL